MSQELGAILQERARIGRFRWSRGLAWSLGLHILVAGLFSYGAWHKSEESTSDVKVTWVTLPGTVGASGGADASEVGKETERLRRVEEVAPKTAAPTAAPTPNTWGTRTHQVAKGTNPNPLSSGHAPVAAKSAQPVPHPTVGAAGSGGGGALGKGSAIPGLRASGGVQGGTGMVGELDASFPFVWYLQNVQNAITRNWYRVSNEPGRVQVYFRIRRDGSLEGARIETTSGYADQDQSALMAVRRSDPLPRLPDGFEGKSLGVRFWFSYTGN